MTKYNSFIVHNDILYTDMDIEEIERKVEISLYDKDSELVTFHILKLTGNMVKMVFYRDFPLEEHDADSIFDTDMILITGFSMNCFRSKEAGGYPLLDLRYNDYNGHWFTVPHEPVPEKYQRDIEALRQKYGDAFKTGLCINLTLQEALSIIHRERKRIDAYSGLVSYLKKEWNITLTITSQKTKSKSL